MRARKTLFLKYLLKPTVSRNTSFNIYIKTAFVLRQVKVCPV